MKKIQTLLCFVVFFGILTNMSAQRKLFTNEIGIVAGGAFISSDYADYSSLLSGNIGYSVGVVHYMNFLCAISCSATSSSSYFRNHFKVRNDFSYARVNLKHHGNITDPNNTSTEAQQYRAMRGQTTIYKVGSSIVYHPISIRDFEGGYQLFLPEISLGAAFVHYKPENYSTLGFLNDPSALPPEYFNNIPNRAGITAALTGSVGTRIKLSAVEDLLLQGRFNYFFSDEIEGVVLPNTKNDMLVNILIGYVYYIDD